jgi:hypothetical protein
MSKTITFNELRKIKDSLPNGSMSTIARELELDEETVRNYFGGTHYENGTSAGIHLEKGPNGGVVEIDNTAILDLALKIIDNN